VFPDVSRDLEHPDDFAYEFVDSLDDGVGMARSEGFEPPTPGSEDLSLTHQLVT
jgi:hypothetical protein